MSLTKTELYLLKEVLTKVKYDKLNKRYVLYLEDYALMNLKSTEIVVLRRLCKENDIFLEELPRILSKSATFKLFEQYNQIKEQISKDKSNDQVLQAELYTIRNKIVEGHMKLVYKLINRYFPEIKKESDREDIYQIGYECLIESVDKYDSSKRASFIYFICNYLMQNIVRKVYNSKENVTNEQAAGLKRLKIAKEHIEKTFDRVPTKEELMQVTGFKLDKLEQLLLIEKFLEPETIEYEEIDIPYELIDYDFEEREIKAILDQNNYLSKITNILPETQKRVIRLYYGFEGGRAHTNEEISAIIGNISAQRVQQIRTKAIYLLSNSLGGEYLQDIYGKIKANPKEKDEPRAIYLYQIFLEDLFIESIPKEELLSIINELQPNNKEIMLLYYGLKDGIKHDYKEIGEILGYDNTTIRNHRATCVNIIIKKYIKKNNPKVKNPSIKYLVNDYINSYNKKKH